MSSQTSTLTNPHQNREQIVLSVAVVFVVAVFTLIYAPIGSNHPNAGGGEMVAVADNLVRQGEFGNPFMLQETGPTAVVAPVYPFFLAALFKMLGQADGRLAAVIFAALLHGLHAALLIQLSRMVFSGRRPGLWAAALVGLFPTIRFMPAWEAIPAATSLLAFCIVSFRWTRQCSASLTKISLLGVMAGGVVLLNPVAGLVAVVWMVLRFRSRWNSLRHPFSVAACFVLMAFVTPLPWAVRNWVLLGAPAIKIGLGGNLYASNNACAQSSLVLNFSTGCWDRHSGRVETELIAGMGEVRYDRYRRQTAMEWIKTNPGAFLHLTGHRMLEFWFPNLAEGPFAVMIWLVTLLSAAGFVVMAKRHVPFLQFAISASLVYPITYYVVVSESRYRIPILWISLLGAGYFLDAAWERYRPSRQFLEDSRR